MALALRLATTQEERQQQPSSFSRRQWSNRENKQWSNSGLPPTTPTGQPKPAGRREGDVPRVQPILVSNAEKAERVRRGLCYHCPEKWVVGHVCKVKLLCYIGEEMEDSEETDQMANIVDDEVITDDLSHLHTLHGHPSSRPFLVIGAIAGREVRVLIDTGATMDFVHPRVAASLQLELTPIRPFRVLVGNGASLLCTHVSRHTKLTMQGNLFLVDLHIVEHHGPDVIPGMAWLESLGKISADFVKKTLEFHRDGKQVFLTGASQGPKEISRQSLAL